MGDMVQPRAAADTTLSLARANLLGIPLFLAILVCVVAPSVLGMGTGAFIVGVHRHAGLQFVLPAIAIGTIAHEFLHGLGWVMAGGRGFGSVRFGFHWKTITPFAHFTEPITAAAYRLGVVLPGIVVGLGPAAAGYLTGEPSLILFGGIFSGAAAGDVMSLWATRGIPGDTLVLDHPSRVGCVVWTPDR